MKHNKDNLLQQMLIYAESQQMLFEEKKIKDEVLWKKYMKQGNMALEKLNGIYLGILERHELEAFDDLMAHENKYVRFMAANLGLKTNPKLAVSTLQKLTELPSPDMVIADAKNALDSWNRGY